MKTELEQLYKQEDKIILKELTESRINEDTKDILNILKYIEEHNPFNVQSEYLVDISTGISYPNANADIGMPFLRTWMVLKLTNISLRKLTESNKWGKSFGWQRRSGT